jgi:hypothetical protein
MRTKLNPREKLLGMGKRFLERGEPIPIDLLAEAERYGLLLEDFGEPRNYIFNNQGEIDGE